MQLSLAALASVNSYVASLSSLVTRHHAAALGASLESSVAALKEEIRSSDSRLGNLNHTHYDVLNGSTHSEQRARARRCVPVVVAVAVAVPVPVPVPVHVPYRWKPNKPLL